MYKISKGISPPQIMKLFERRNEHLYNLRQLWIFAAIVNSVYRGTKSISYLSLRLIPDAYKNIDSLYKKVIKK